MDCVVSTSLKNDTLDLAHLLANRIRGEAGLGVLRTQADLGLL